MPAPIDLTGRRFGKLTVVSRAGYVRYGGKVSAWLCRCDCGVSLTVPRTRLPYYPGINASQIVDACDACRLGRACVVCGKAFIPTSSKAITCSEACRKARRNETILAAAKQRFAKRPELKKAAQDAYRARVKADPARYRSKLEKQKAWYEAHRDEIKAEAKARRQQMSAADREQMREYMRHWQAELRADPQRHAEYLAMQSETRRTARLAALVRLGANLGGKL